MNAWKVGANVLTNSPKGWNCIQSTNSIMEREFPRSPSPLPRSVHFCLSPKNAPLNLGVAVTKNQPFGCADYRPMSMRLVVRACIALAYTFALGSLPATSFAQVPGCPQTQPADSPKANEDSQLRVSWLYGSFVPKEVPLECLNGHQRFKLYIRQTYTTWGIYLKTTISALSDSRSSDGFAGVGKQLATRQEEYIIQNSVTSLGDGLLGWEPRYDRCHCSGFWPRTRHAILRDFVTYDRTEQNLRPQLFPYVGAFVGSFTGAVSATAWGPGTVNSREKGYQAVITQIPVGMAIDWVGEFAPDIARIFHRHKHAT